MTIQEAKNRLDALIKKSRAHLYKPIGIAEILYRNRMDKNLQLDDRNAYRRKSYDWCREVSYRLYQRRPDLNSRYWDQLFDAGLMAPQTLVALGKVNCDQDGLVETYIYGHLLDKYAGLLDIARDVQEATAISFKLSGFLSNFEDDERFRRSVDKAYEIVVYALFSVVTKYLEAKVNLTVDPNSPLLKDFEEFARLVLGVDCTQPTLSQPARLYRVGVANAADTGLDMWANFGPAIQVKHLSLSPSRLEGICDSVQADQIVIVCKSSESRSIESVLNQVGYGQRIRGIITEIELEKWYQIACNKKYRDTVGKDLIRAIYTEMNAEFPLTQAKVVNDFMHERGYDINRLSGTWAL